MGRKFDYIALKNEYVQTPGLSIRALCERHGITSWSSVNKVKNTEGWDRLRDEFNRQVESKSLEALSFKRAQKITEIQLDTLSVIHQGILKMSADMEATESYEVNGEIKTRPVMRIGPRDLAILIDKFQTLIGAPQSIHENRDLGIDVLASADEAALRELLSVLRPRAALGSGSGATPAPDPAKARSN